MLNKFNTVIYGLVMVQNSFPMRTTKEHQARESVISRYHFFNKNCIARTQVWHDQIIIIFLNFIVSHQELDSTYLDLYDNTLLKTPNDQTVAN